MTPWVHVATWNDLFWHSISPQAGVVILERPEIVPALFQQPPVQPPLGVMGISGNHFPPQLQVDQRTGDRLQAGFVSKEILPPVHRRPSSERAVSSTTKVSLGFIWLDQSPFGAFQGKPQPVKSILPCRPGQLKQPLRLRLMPKCSETN